MTFSVPHPDSFGSIEEKKKRRPHCNTKMRQHHDKYACYRDQVSSISSYRCKRPNSVKTLQRDKKIETEENVWKNIIKSKEKDLESEIHQRIIESKQSLLECNERLFLKNQELPVLLKAAKIIADYYVLVTLRLTWNRVIEARKVAAAIALLQSKWRSIVTRKKQQQHLLALKIAFVVKIQSYARRLVARRRHQELKKKRLVRERVVRLYVARCQRQRRTKMEKRMGMVRERAIRQYVTHHKRKRRKVIELEHKAATTCQAAFRGFFARRHTDIDHRTSS